MAAVRIARRGLSAAAGGFRQPVIALLPGSARDGSVNVKLAKAAAAMCESHGATTRMVDLKALGLPLYDQDVEEASGMPPGAVELKGIIADADGCVPRPQVPCTHLLSKCLRY